MRLRCDCITQATSWRFELPYAHMSAFMPLVHPYLAASRLPTAEREEALRVGHKTLIRRAKSNCVLNKYRAILMGTPS